MPGGRKVQYLQSAWELWVHLSLKAWCQLEGCPVIMHRDDCQRAPGTVLADVGCPRQSPGTACTWSTGQRLFPKGSVEEASLFWWPEFSPMNTSHGQYLLLEPTGTLSPSADWWRLQSARAATVPFPAHPRLPVTPASPREPGETPPLEKLACGCRAWPWVALQPLTKYTPEMGPDPAKAAPGRGQQGCTLYEYAATYSL